ncbi:hypothetical protein BV20DRAFT_119615 [Pilatotrama ljubarskyi]|nr:hypothetical protein BV20DRAFT_119615 [Pilatotrama ljubarskyi]
MATDCDIHARSESQDYFPMPASASIYGTAHPGHTSRCGLHCRPSAMSPSPLATPSCATPDGSTMCGSCMGGSDSGAEHHIVSAKDLQEVLLLVITHQVRRRGSVSKRQRAVRQALLLRFGRRLFGSGAANGCPEGLSQMGHTQNNRIKAIRRFIQRTTEVHAHGFAASSNEDGRRWEPLTTELVSDDECDGEEWHDV